MAQAPDLGLMNPQVANTQGSSLIDMKDWMRTEAEADANNETERSAGKTANGASKKNMTSPFESTARVTGRPTTSMQPLMPSPQPEVDLGGKNWVGLLLEYRQAQPILSEPDYKEAYPGLNCFAYTVSIAESPSPICDSRVFSKKKDAKQYAAKLAIEWLIANRHMPDDGTVSFPKQRSQALPQANSAQGSAGNEGLSSGPSYGQQVAQLAMRLGLSPPMYVINRHEQFHAMCNGYAHFSGDPRVPGQIGEFKNVYGQKKAKEGCAKEVLAVLENMMALRTRNNGSPTSGNGHQDVREQEEEIKATMHDLVTN